MRRFEVVEQSSLDAVRHLTGTDKLRLVDQLFEFAQGLVRCRVRDQHPDWTDERIAAEVARRIRGDAI